MFMLHLINNLIVHNVLVINNLFSSEYRWPLVRIQTRHKEAVTKGLLIYLVYLAYLILDISNFKLNLVII